MMKTRYLTTILLLCTIPNVAQTTFKDSLRIPPRDTTKKATVSLASTNNPYVPNNIPPSANAASLGKYGDNPVSYYTGSVSSSVGLYTIQSKDLSLPLSVSYHHGGIKVEEESSYVGLGMAGNFGGVVTRTIKGLDDLKNKGIPFHPLPADPENDTYFKNNIDDGNWGFPGVDTEPDIFYYNVGGVSGKFILAAGNSFPLKGIPLDRSDIDITCSLLSTGSNPPVYGGPAPQYQWVITLADGTQYTFTEQEITTTLSGFSATLSPQYYENNPSFIPAFDYNFARSGHNITAWYLTQVYSVNSLKTITLVYDNTAPYYSTSRISANEVYQKSIIEPFPTTGCITPATLTNKTSGFNYNVNVTRNAYLKSIYFDNGTVDFTYGNRLDIQQYFPNGDGGNLSFPTPIYLGDIEDRNYAQTAKKPQKLERIKVKDANGRLVKQFDFTYSYFNYQYLASAESPSFADYMTQYNQLRLRLDKITEKDTLGSNDLPPHEFRYVGDTYDANGNRLSMATLPSKTSWAKDYYGYYNGKETNNALANIHIIPKLAYPKRIGDKTFSGNYFFTTIGYANTFDIGIDREVDTTLRAIGSLSEIYYPTGGHTTFGYGFHKAMGGAGEVEATVYEATKDSTPPPLVIPTGDNNRYTADIEFKLRCTFLTGTGSECLPTIPPAIANTWYGKIQSFGNVLLNRNYDDWANKFCTNSGGATLCTFTYVANNTTMPTGTHQLSINPQTFVGQQLPIASGKMIYYKPHDTHYKEIVVGGLRIDKITDYTPEGVAKTRLFSYTNDDGSSTGKQLRPATKFITGYTEQLRVADQTNPWSSGCSRKFWSVEMNAHSLTPLGSSASGNMVAYSKVRVREVDANNVSTNGYSQYEYHNEADILPTSVLFVDIPSQADLQNGRLIREAHYDQTGAILRETLYQNLLKGTQSNFYDGMQFLYGGVNANGSLRLAKGLYKIPAQFWFTAQKIERHYTGADYLQTTNNYDYGSSNHNLMIGQDSDDSKNNVLSSRFKYPAEMVAGGLDPTGVYAQMVTKHILSPVVETKTFFNTTQTSRKLVNYGSYTGSGITFFLPKSVQTQLLTTDPLITQVNFLSYDARANLTQYSERKGQTTTLGYANNTGSVDLVTNITVGGGSAGTVLARSMAYEYLPLVGLKKTTDINGYSTTSIFDNFNRLQAVKDAQNYLLADNYYHYQNGVLTPNLGMSPSATNNYVVSRQAREAQRGTLLSNSVDSTTTQIQFLDGLGKPTQSILWKATPDKTKDLLATTTLYDALARPHKNVLPTPSDGALGAYKSTALSLANTFYGDTYPYTETMFEPSPLNRPRKQFGAGQAWRVTGNEKFVTIQYLLAGNGIVRFDLLPTGVISGATNYDNSTLLNHCMLSERGFQTYELKDKLGRVTHKFQQLQTGFTYAVTAYVYNDLSQLVAVIPPEAYQKFGTGTGQITSLSESDEVYKELCFGYHYDGLGRLIEKHIPGAGWRYSVFNKNDIEVFFADEQDKANGYWQWRKVDALGREIQSGILSGIGSTTRATLQTAFDTFTGQNYETLSPTGLLGYTNTSFPSTYAIVNADARTVMYYDDYAWQTDNNYTFKAAQAFAPQGLTKGLVTGTLVRNVETNDWYKFVNYYDYKARIIQQFSQNHVGGIDRTDYQYRFNGEVLKMRITHPKTGAKDVTELYEYAYDHMGRKTAFTHNSKVVTKYEYDPIGRLMTKKFSPAGTNLLSAKTGNWNTLNTWQSGVLPLANDNVTINTGQTITIPSGEIASAGTLNDRGTLRNLGTLNLGKYTTTDLYNQTFKYHIRGGLRGINLDANNNLTNSLFSFKLGYEDAGFYDGNIGKQEWRSNIDNVTRSYTYTYDGASRILSGTYAGAGSENYSLNSVTYDANGNIKTLSRNGYKSNNTFGLVDNLTYTYNTNSNKILKVDDASSETASFKDVTGNDYTYYPDGSLKSDANKGITVIEYNYLKLPRRVVQNGVTTLYQYDASGKKLKETIGTQVTDYVGNKIYKANQLYQIAHDEGRIIGNEYEYNIKDHLGNLRVAFRDSLGVAKITQANSYGIWGEDLPTLSYLKSTWRADNFKFTGKEELQGTGYIDFGARWYDNIVPRFTTIDPLSELSRRFSPYVYGNANPLRFIDPDGMASRELVGADGLTNDQWLAARGDVEQEKAFRQENEDKDKDKKKKEEAKKISSSVSNNIKNETTSQASFSPSLPWGLGVSTAMRSAANFLRMATGTVLGVVALAFTMEGDTPHKDNDDEYFTFYHYTNEKGLAGILATNKILPNVKGKVYMTQSLMAAADVVQNLFLGSPKHSDRGDYLVAFKLTQYQISQLQTDPSAPFEIVYPNGTLKLEKLIYAGPNPTK